MQCVGYVGSVVLQNVGVGTVARMGVGAEGTSRGAPEYTAGRAGHGRQMMQIHASGRNGWSAPSGRKHNSRGKSNKARRELDEQRQTTKLGRVESVREA